MSKAKQFYLSDEDCPLAYEPSGEDFLSACIGEADLMRRLLSSQEFARWLRTFMPPISTSGTDKWLQPVVSPDPSWKSLLIGGTVSGHRRRLAAEGFNRRSPQRPATDAVEL